MSVNNILFVPQITGTTNSGIVMSSGASGGSDAHIEGGHHGVVSTPITFPIKEMSSYQQQRFLAQFPCPQHGYPYFQQSKYFYNQNYPLMNPRPPAPIQQLPPTQDGFNTMSSEYNNNNCQSLVVYQQQQNSLINTNEVSSNNQVQRYSASSTPISISKNNKNNNNKKQTGTKDNFEEIPNKDKKNNNKDKNFEKPPQKQQKFKNTANNGSVWYTKKNWNKQSNSTTNTNTALKTVNEDIKNNEQQIVKYDTMQRNSSKASQNTSTKSQHNNKNGSTDLVLSANSHYHYHHHHHRHHYNNNNNYRNTTAKQRNQRNNNKRQDAPNNTQNAYTANGQKRRGSSGFTVNDWLPNNMYYYERRFISSCGEDNMISRHNPAHRNSTSSEAAGSDDFNSNNSNENFCPAHGVQTNSSKKITKSKQKRQQKRKQFGANGNNTIVNTAQPMDIDEESKENLKPSVENQISSPADTNLRKQCTKAAAFNAALSNSKFANSSSNPLTKSASNSSVSSSLSSASSISSVNFSSSASSSPTHSANSSPTASPTASKRNAEHLNKVTQSLTPPLKLFTKLNMSECELVHEMQRYVVEPGLLRMYGFPVESIKHEGCIEIYKCIPKHISAAAVIKDNRRHFYGRRKQWYPYNSADSGHGSGDSSPRSTDSDSSEMGEDETITPVMAFYTPDGIYQIFPGYHNSSEKECARCKKMFQVTEEGEYLTLDPCNYHCGKLHTVYNGECYVSIYSCCQGEKSSMGCTQYHLHVYNGTIFGINGPYTDFEYTQRKEIKHYTHPKIYSIDCEMSYTGLGLEVTKVTIIGYDGSLVYEHFVRPQAAVIDYNTRYSGITEKDFSADSNNSIKTFNEVRQDLLNLLDADDILIGHNVDNDLKALRLVHKTVVDTSVVFDHSTGYPYRRSLRNLMKVVLGRDIQCGDKGHNSLEDSRSCLELMLWKVHEDSCHWDNE